jgi:hypothetical protein
MKSNKVTDTPHSRIETEIDTNRRSCRLKLAFILS